MITLKLLTLAFGKESPRRLTELAFESNGATSVASWRRPSGRSGFPWNTSARDSGSLESPYGTAANRPVGSGTSSK